MIGVKQFIKMCNAACCIKQALENSVPSPWKFWLQINFQVVRLQSTYGTLLYPFLDTNERDPQWAWTVLLPVSQQHRISTNLSWNGTHVHPWTLKLNLRVKLHNTVFLSSCRPICSLSLYAISNTNVTHPYCNFKSDLKTKSHFMS